MDLIVALNSGQQSNAESGQPVRWSRLALICGLGLLAIAGAASGQAPAKGADDPPKPALWDGFGPKEISKEAAVALRKAQLEIREHFFDPETHVRLARAYREAGAPLMAFRILFFAISRHFGLPDFIPVYVKVMGDATTIKLSRPGAEVLADAEKEIGNKPKDAMAWREYGRLLMQAGGRETEAISALRNAVELDPDCGACHASLAVALAAQGQEEYAAESLATFLETHPGDVDVSIELADLARRRSLVEARGILRGAIMANPESARLHFALGYMTTGVGEPDAALHSLKRATEIDPRNPVYLAWRARTVLIEKEDRDAALELYLDAWFMDPTVKELTEVFKRITSIMEDEAGVALGLVHEPSGLLSHFDDLNPMVALGSWSMAFQQEGVRPQFLEFAFRQLAHDEETVRFQAARYIAERAGSDQDAKILALHENQDPFVRGLALYIDIQRNGERARPHLLSALQSENVYLRFEALSALKELAPGWGEALMTGHMQTETDPHLRRVFGR